MIDEGPWEKVFERTEEQYDVQTQIMRTGRGGIPGERIGSGPVRQNNETLYTGSDINKTSN